MIQRVSLWLLLVSLLLASLVPAILGWRLIAAYSAIPRVSAAIERQINLSTDAIPPPASGQGIAVARDGAIFVADPAGERLLAYPRGTEASGLVIASRAGERPLRGFGLALGPDGLLYFLDDATGLVSVFSQAGSLMRSGPRASPGARAITVDGAGNIYVADTGAQLVRKFLTDGRTDSAWGEAITPGATHLAGVIGLAAWSGNLYAAGDHELVMLDRKGQLRCRRNLIGPAGMLAVGPDGTLYMSDIFANRVWVLDPEGRTVGRVVGIAGNEDIFRQPRGVAVTSDWRLYVVNDAKVTVYSLTQRIEQR